MIKHHPLTPNNEHGYTLIEVMIALCISVIISICVFAMYKHHQNLYKKHQVISNLQQNLRASMYLLEKDIRAACLDITGSAHPRILVADSQAFLFQADLDGNGNYFRDLLGNRNSIDGNTTEAHSDTTDPDKTDPNEEIEYTLSASTDSFGLNSLMRISWGTSMSMVDNIEILDFRYFDDSDNVLNPDDGNPATVEAVSASNLLDIRSVEVTLVSRSDRGYNRQRDSRPYSNLNGTVLVDASTAGNTNYYRKSLSKRIMLRNM